MKILSILIILSCSQEEKKLEVTNTKTNKSIDLEINSLNLTFRPNSNYYYLNNNLFILDKEFKVFNFDNLTSKTIFEKGEGPEEISDQVYLNFYNNSFYIFDKIKKLIFSYNISDDKKNTINIGNIRIMGDLGHSNNFFYKKHILRDYDEEIFVQYFIDGKITKNIDKKNFYLEKEIEFNDIIFVNDFNRHYYIFSSQLAEIIVLKKESYKIINRIKIESMKNHLEGYKRFKNLNTSLNQSTGSYCYAFFVLDENRFVFLLNQLIVISLEKDSYVEKQIELKFNHPNDIRLQNDLNDLIIISPDSIKRISIKSH